VPVGDVNLYGFMRRTKRIGILTAGGDCPGLNAVIRAVVKTATHDLGYTVTGFLDGYHGLVTDRSRPLKYDDVANILTRGGTILGMSRRERFFRIGDDVRDIRDYSSSALRVFRKNRLECLVTVGGEGTLTAAAHLNRIGMPVVGVPKTIDNDVRHTDQCFGFDSACAVATEAVDRLHTTADSHHRVMVLEVMGRTAGWLALSAGMAGGGDVILIPEIPFHWQAVCAALKRRVRLGRRFSIVVVSEGARAAGEGATWVTKGRAGKAARLGGIGTRVARDLERLSGLECRETILGYLQRGGSPTHVDRLLATRFGHAATRLAAEGGFGRMVCLAAGEIGSVPLADVSGAARTVPTDSPLLATARAVGTSFGE
jgi:6-phosphofructokinase 1